MALARSTLDVEGRPPVRAVSEIRIKPARKQTSLLRRVRWRGRPSRTSNPSPGGGLISVLAGLATVVAGPGPVWTPVIVILSASLSRS